MFNIFSRSDVIIERSKSSNFAKKLFVLVGSIESHVLNSLYTHIHSSHLFVNGFLWWCMSQVTPIDALVFIFIFLFALSSWHSARKRFPCHKIVFLNFHIPPRALHPPSIPLPFPPLHYFTLFSRISPTHLSLSVGHISPEEKPVLYILHLL